MEETKEIWRNLFVDVIKNDIYDLVSIQYDYTGLAIVYVGSSHNLKINFEGHVDVFRKLDEFACLSIYENTEGLPMFRRNVKGNPFFRVKNSNLLKEIGILSGGIDGGFYSEDLGKKHYCLVTRNEIIDIIYNWEPTIEISEIN